MLIYVHINLMCDKSIFMGQQTQHALTHCRLHGFYFERYFKRLSPLIFALHFLMSFSFSFMRCHNAICCFGCSICQENKYAFFMHITNLFTLFIDGGSIQKLDFFQCLHYSQCQGVLSGFYCVDMWLLAQYYFGPLYTRYFHLVRDKMSKKKK